MNKLRMEKLSDHSPQLSKLSKTVRYSAIASAVLFSMSAQSQLLHNLTIGNPKALGLANAVTADPPGIDSIHFNPAGLAKIKGRQYNVKFIAAHTQSTNKFGEPESPSASQKAGFYSVNEDCIADYPANDAAAHDACWGEDPIQNTTSEFSNPTLMLPFIGLTELPVLGIVSGGVAVEDPNRGWTIGTAAYSPEGIGFKRDPGDPVNGGDPGNYQGMEVGLTRFTYFSPTIALKLSEELSFGVGINFSYQGFGYDSYLRAPSTTLAFVGTLEQDIDSLDIDDFLELSVLHPYDTVGRLKMEMEDILSVGFNMGFLWEPTEWIAFGVAYQSEATSQMSGDFEISYTDEFVATTQSMRNSGLDLLLGSIFNGGRFNAGTSESGTVEAEMIKPQSLAFGTSVKVLPNLKINFDLKWIEYSVWDELEFEFDTNVDFLTLGSMLNSIANLSGAGIGDNADMRSMRLRRGYEDAWSIAIGGEYEYNDNLVLRAGYEPRTSSVPADSTDLLLPIRDADLFTAGFGYQWNKTTRFDGAFGYLISKYETKAGESRNANSDIEGDVIYNPFYSLPFETKTESYLFTISMDKKF